MKRSESILKEHGLRRTDFRIKLIDILLGQDHKAISSSVVEESLGDFDRVTLYRTLKSFENKGMIHKVVGESGEPRYAMCDSKCKVHSNVEEHAHFNCTNCNQTFCLRDKGEISISLPQNFKLLNTDITLSGVCAQCN